MKHEFKIKAVPNNNQRTYLILVVKDVFDDKKSVLIKGRKRKLYLYITIIIK